MNSLESRRFDVWGAPFDGGATLGRPGARYGPAQVRKELNWMAMRQENGEVYSLDSGLVHPAAEGLISDKGDVDVVAQDIELSLDACSRAVDQTMRSGRVPIVIGGDCSFLFACVRAFHDFVEGSVALLHFDAHLDLLDESEQQGRYSQSSGVRRCLELDRFVPEASIQVGVRNFNFPSSRKIIKDSKLGQLSAVEFDELGTRGAVERILDVIGRADHVFWSFDIDAIDPAFAPGAAAHEPGGLTSRQAIDCVRALSPYCEGFALTEVNPLTDQRDMTATLAAYLVYDFALYGQQQAALRGH